MGDIKYKLFKAWKARQNYFPAILAFSLHKELFISLFEQHKAEIIH